MGYLIYLHCQILPYPKSEERGRRVDFYFFFLSKICSFVFFRKTNSYFHSNLSVLNKMHNICVCSSMLSTIFCMLAGSKHNFSIPEFFVVVSVAGFALSFSFRKMNLESGLYLERSLE